MLNNSSGFIISGGQFINYPSNNKGGLKKLFNATIPEAAYDSYARSYAPKCFPGTRERQIRDFASWVSDFIADQDRHFRMTWISGPAGVGKSAIAQTFAEEMSKSHLGAAFFFSQPNHRGDLDRFFPSIAYQISTTFKPFASLLDEKIRADPALLFKTLEVQFQELIVAPFLELKARNVEVQERLVIVDGLDECSNDNAQCVIVIAIARAVQRYGDDLPLLWAFFSRPEPHIARTFTSELVSPLCRSLTLPISREIDNEIRLYLQAGFNRIRERSNLTLSSDTSWPSEKDITTLVNKTNGLYAYSATILGFVGDPDALDAKERLEAILSTHSNSFSSTSDHQNPFRELDALYTLIMRRIPRDVLPFTLAILLLFDRPSLVDRAGAEVVPVLSSLLGLTSQSLDRALSKLHSVLRLDFKIPWANLRAGSNESTMMPWRIHFYHDSFMEYLTNPERCGLDFWIRHPLQYSLLAKCGLVFLDRVYEAHQDSQTLSIDRVQLSMPLEHLSRFCAWHLRFRVYESAWRNIFNWLDHAAMEESLLVQLISFNFEAYWRLGLWNKLSHDKLQKVIAKVPVEYQKQLFQPVQPDYPLLNQLKDLLLPERWKNEPMYVLGQGKKSVVLRFGSNRKINK